jgi:hypothetical protein
VKGKPEKMSPVDYEFDGDCKVKLSWSAPADNGSPISKYTVKVLDKSKTLQEIEQCSG